MNVGSDVHLHPDASRGERRLGKLERLMNRFRQIEPLRVSVASPQHLAQAPDELAGALVARNDVIDNRAHFLEIHGLLREVVLRRLRVAQDRRERLIELVRECCGELTQLFDARKMDELFLATLPLVLRTLVLSDLENGSAGVQYLAACVARDPSLALDPS